MTGLLNLHDFPCEVSTFPIVMSYPSFGTGVCDDDDRALVTSVDAVLDMHSAKAALGSLEALRIVPFQAPRHQQLPLRRTDSLTVPSGAGPTT